MKLEILARYNTDGYPEPGAAPGARQWHDAGTWLREGDCIAFLSREDREAIDALDAAEREAAEYAAALGRAHAKHDADEAEVARLRAWLGRWESQRRVDAWPFHEIADALAGKEPPR